jgi:CheY-like chemotaxis protein
MSYPCHIQTLIVEDEQDPVENYRHFFQELAKLDVAPPVIAWSHDDAVRHLSSNSIFHLVIIDLGLPYATHDTAKAGVDPGIDLVQRAAARECYPVPALLVISGRLGQAQLPSLGDLLATEFWHGTMVNKGPDQDEAIERAIEEVRRYCHVGIHLRDAGGKLCPTISPREEDLLRRCVLGQTQCVGLDLEWWGTYPNTSVSAASAGGQVTKVLMGRFLLRDGKESSRPSFFKFEPNQSAVLSHEAAELMVQKLSHVKICSRIRSLNRSLLVTQQVGGSSSRPISLAEMLTDDSEATREAIPQAVSDIVGQLASLGSATEDRLAVSALLWKWHDVEKIKAALNRHGGGTESMPVRLLEKLHANKDRRWVRCQTCTHGDLNATNIALEAVDGSYRAYIFDAAGMRADTAVRDLATLETTLLLHQRSSLGESLVTLCQAIYDPGVTIPNFPPSEESPAIVRNTFNFIREIRRHALQANDVSVYALIVFDCAMIQLGGLAIQSRQNKITNAANAVKLAELTANWLVSVAPWVAEVAAPGS